MYVLSLHDLLSILPVGVYMGYSQGTMGFSSEGRGFGSTFYFEIPLYGSKGSVSFAPTAYITQPVDKKRSCVITDSLHSLRWPKPPNLMVSIGPYMMIPSKEGASSHSSAL
jgi:hypothetical protein